MAEQFLEMTGCNDKGLAEFYLASAGGDVNQAVNLYFESVKGSSKIATLSGSLKNESSTYFAGGEKSGVLLQGKEDKPLDIVQDIVNLAAQSKPFDDEPVDSSHYSNSFTGTGFELGATRNNSTSIQEKVKEENQSVCHGYLYNYKGFKNFTFLEKWILN